MICASGGGGDSGGGGAWYCGGGRFWPQPRTVHAILMGAWGFSMPIRTGRSVDVKRLGAVYPPDRGNRFPRLNGSPILTL